MYDEDPLVPLDQFKEMALSASDVARHAISADTPMTLGAKLLVACTALRAYQYGATQTIKTCCLAWLPVARCFDQQFTACINFGALCDIIESLTRNNMRNHEDELSGLDISQAQKDMALSKCARASEVGLSKKKKLYFARSYRCRRQATARPLMKQQIVFVNFGETCSAPVRAPSVLSCLIPCSLSSNLPSTTRVWQSRGKNFRKSSLPNASLHLVLTVYHVVCIVALEELEQHSCFQFTKSPCRARPCPPVSAQDCIHPQVNRRDRARAYYPFS